MTSLTLGNQLVAILKVTLFPLYRWCSHYENSCELGSVTFIFLTMPESCCAEGCSQKRDIEAGIELYRIPKEKNMREKWIAARNS